MVTSFTFDREQAKKYFGEQDLRDFASDEGTFRNFVLTINRYFYEGVSTPEQILALSKLDAAAAQERMQQMASGDFLEKTKEGAEQSLSYQMILADSLVGEIAAQKLTSSNPAHSMMSWSSWASLHSEPFFPNLRREVSGMT